MNTDKLKQGFGYQLLLYVHFQNIDLIGQAADQSYCDLFKAGVFHPACVCKWVFPVLGPFTFKQSGPNWSQIKILTATKKRA